MYLRKDLLKVPIPFVNLFFIFLYFVAYTLVFTVFGKEFTAANTIVEVLPVIGMAALTFGFAGCNAKAVRLCSLIYSLCRLIYNIINFSISGILCEVFSLFSAMIRLNFTQKKKDT